MEIADQLKNTKIWIGDNPYLAKRVQETLFEHGVKWNSNDTKVRSRATCLYIHEGLTITMMAIADGIDYTRGHYDSQNLKEITPEELFKLSKEGNKNQDKDMSWVVKAEDNHLLRAFSEMLKEKGLYAEAVTFLNTGRDVLSNTYGSLEKFSGYQECIAEDRSYEFHLPEDWEVAKEHILKAASVRKQPELRVEGYSAEFKEDSVEIGCIEIHPSIFRELKKLMEESGKDISVKVGGSFIYQGEIRQIADYYRDPISKF